MCEREQLWIAKTQVRGEEKVGRRTYRLAGVFRYSIAGSSDPAGCADHADEKSVRCVGASMPCFELENSMLGGAGNASRYTQSHTDGFRLFVRSSEWACR